MKILTAEQMRRIDALTVEAGFPNLLLMENAGSRVVEVLERIAAPLEMQRVVIFCGKGNNGGDGLVVARHLLTRRSPASLHVFLTADPESLSPDARTNLQLFLTSGGKVVKEITGEMQAATLIIDAMLGTGLTGPAREPVLSFIRAWNDGFPLAKRVAVDVPSGLSSDCIGEPGEHCRVDACVTFTALRHCHTIPPWCDLCGDVTVGHIGTPDSFLADDASLKLEMVTPGMLWFLGRSRAPSAHKGDFGHVLVLGGSRGKFGAIGMTGMAALRAGAGLVTVSTVASAITALLHLSPELMSAPLAETHDGYIDAKALHGPGGRDVLDGKTVVAAGPGLGVVRDTREMMRSLMANVEVPLVLDADALNILATEDEWPGERLLVLTPHPGEMARLCNLSTSDVQANRVECALDLASRRNAVIVLKGQRTAIAFPDGDAFVNPTGSPAMATAGSGDILTGMIASLLAQYADRPKLAIAAAVYLHGLAGEIGAGECGEASLVATDLLRYLPQAFAQIAAAVPSDSRQ